uniref:Probable glycine dehydrogenase (decarboxylating) subunit 1 n=1 Tax=candidate division WOR-3 bacterium TaxID=2052148 RepID=A0A7C3YTM3_UNCW3
MKYTPHTEEEKREMLARIGISAISDLFAHIPKEIRLQEPLPIPFGLSEFEAKRLLEGLAKENKPSDDFINFLGGGAYDHLIPAVIPHLLQRSEYYTAYTPYQAEVSQGTLQTIFEFQSLICELFNMDVANASMYDGASALAEGCLMAVAIKKRRKILLPSSLNPLYRTVVETYLKGGEVEIVYLPTPEGRVDPATLERIINQSFAGVVVQYPNFFGILEPMAEISEIVHRNDLLFIVVTDPISLGILRPPGDYSADIAVGEGQSLGIPLSFGGPYLGLLATKQEFVRFIPGRLVGKTVDLDGSVAYVLTLQTREQHIKRERATSNICTNSALCALAATIYLSLLGREGLKEVGLHCLNKSHYLLEMIESETKFRRAFHYPFFKEFVLRGKSGIWPPILKALKAKGILGGINLGRFRPDWDEFLLIAVTEKRTKEELDFFVSALKEIGGNYGM